MVLGRQPCATALVAALAAALAAVLLTSNPSARLTLLARLLNSGKQPQTTIGAQEVASRHTPVPEWATEASNEIAACRLSGQVVDCGCDFVSVERMNQRYLYPLLTELCKQPFYRFFKVNLYCDCQFWPDSGMCHRRDCAVSECEPHDIPHSWKEHDKALEEARNSKSRGDEPWAEQAGQVDRSVDAGVQGALKAVVDWRALDNPWLPEDEPQGTYGSEYTYVDLTRNEEKYTGYKGEDARRIWAAIYDQSALREVAQAEVHAPVPHEQQVLFRLISGMHTSITTSIVKNFYDEETETWGPNLPFFKARFASPSSRPHIENLFFTFLFVLRATTKAGAALTKLDYDSAWGPEKSQRTQQLVSELIHSPELQAACPVPFDEGLLWRQDPERSDILRQQLRTAFHNITRLMDCVGCEKCKLNGKLNMLGIATALKVLFAQPDPPPSNNGAVTKSGDDLVLERNEAIALVNFLAKLSDSVETVRSLSNKLREQQGAEEGIAGVAKAA